MIGTYVTARLKGKTYPLQGWVTSLDPLEIKHSDGTKSACQGTPAVVTNPPERPHYLAFPDTDGKWFFTTPDSRYSGFKFEGTCQGLANSMQRAAIAGVERKMKAKQ
jgi:hypothetical protein